MEEKILIPNLRGEKLDVLIEGKKDAQSTIVFVHGFGADKNEGGNYFTEVAQAFSGIYRIIRFDFSGYGKSEGKQEEVDYTKQTEDLQAVLDYAHKNFIGQVIIFAHSMGCLVTAMLNPNDITKAIFTSIPNYNTKHLSQFFQNWIGKKPGGIVDTQGITIFPRSAGGIQKIGSSFWKVMEGSNPLVAVSEFAKKTKLLIIHALEDPIIGQEFVGEYKDISGVEDVWIHGDHNYTKPEDRKVLIEKVRAFLG